MKRAFTVVAVILIALAIYVAVVPTLQAPDWVVTVHDANGNPLAGWTVLEVWQDYSCESTEHVTRTQTSSDGAAHFQPITNHRNILRCATETLEQLQAGVHASLGRHARVEVGGVICVTDNRGYCVDWTGQPPKMKSDVTSQ